MRILGLEIIKHSRYEWLIKEITKLAIDSVHLNKDIALAECKVRVNEAKTELYGCINRELQDKLKHKNAKRDKNGRFSK